MKNTIYLSGLGQAALFVTALYFIAYQGWGAVLANAPVK